MVTPDHIVHGSGSGYLKNPTAIATRILHRIGAPKIVKIRTVQEVMIAEEAHAVIK